jgi:hypothetical protein
MVEDDLRSDWTVEGLLAELPGFRRADDGSDLLAFRLVGNTPARSAYVYLYGGDPGLIHFDLEDESAETGRWDHAVRRGSARSLEELRGVIGPWLQGAG